MNRVHEPDVQIKINGGTLNDLGKIKHLDFLFESFPLTSTYHVTAIAERRLYLPFKVLQSKDTYVLLEAYKICVGSILEVGVV